MAELRELRAGDADVVADVENPTGATHLYERVGLRVALRSDSWQKRL